MELVALLNERTHSARYRGHGYVPLSFRGEGGGGGGGGEERRYENGNTTTATTICSSLVMRR